MRMPFGKLMELVCNLNEEDQQLPMRILAERWNESANRIADAADALKICRGEPAYVDEHGFHFIP